MPRQPPISESEHSTLALRCIAMDAQIRLILDTLENRKGCGVRHLDRAIKIHRALTIMKVELADMMTNEYGSQCYFPKAKDAQQT